MPEAMSGATGAAGDGLQILKTGIFRDADSFHKGSGQATIYQEGRRLAPTQIGGFPDH